MITKKINAMIVVSILSGITIFGFLYTFVTAEINEKDNIKAETLENKMENKEEAFAVSGPRVIEVLLQRHYLDGEISEEIIEHRVISMEDFWAEYSGWELVAQDQGRMVFRKEVEDISPLLKAVGHFGISADGSLTIYKGKPASNNAVQSFFQIDVGKLESRKHKELKNGIPVQSIDHYREVIESLKIYSLRK